MINFNRPTIIGREQYYMSQVLMEGRFSGNHRFSAECNALLKELFKVPGALVTSSGTHSLEMSAILSEIKEGDEVIMSPFTFSSTANAFVLRGARIVFVDIRPDTMNIDERLIEQAISSKTKAIVVVHYAGISCEMDQISEIARKNGLFIIEDAAQAFGSFYKNKACGTLGHFGCFSFHETKNIQCGEGGAILVNSTDFLERAEIIQEKGTDRKKFFRGQVDKYTWVDVGSSYLLSELNASFLLAQLEAADEVTRDRLDAWAFYFELLSPLAKDGLIGIPVVPQNCTHNGHIFYIKANDLKERNELLSFLNQEGVWAVFHYIPLHTSPAGLKHGRFRGEDVWTTRESERLLRLPLYYKINKKDLITVAKTIALYYGKKIPVERLSYVEEDREI